MRRYNHLSEFAAVALLLTVCSGCAQMSTLPRFDAAADATTTGSSTPKAAIDSQPLDPLTASADAVPGTTDPMLASPPPDAMSTDGGSQRVPLGSFASSASAPTPITQPRPQTQAGQPSPLQNMLTPQNASVAENAPAPQAPAAVSAPPPTVPSTSAQPLPTPQAAPVAASAPPASAETKEKYEGLLAEFLKRDRPAEDMPEPDTVVISSSTPTPVVETREFIPAGLNSTAMPTPEPVIALSAAQRNILQRFETLKRLLDESLITTEEYARRRQVNIGGFLPYTRDPAPVGLERPVPSADAIVARLAALRRAFEMRAISPRQHALERTMILNALLPEAPSERMLPKPPPADVLEGATMVGQLEILRGRAMISDQEFDAERIAIDQMLKTGRLPEQRTASSAKAATAAASSAQTKPAATNAATSSSTPVESEITGPVLHLASFRSQDAAKKGWNEAVERNSEILKSLKPVIRRVDLGEDRGVFYRLLTGPFTSLAEAEATCIKLKQNNQFCRVSADGA